MARPSPAAIADRRDKLRRLLAGTGRTLGDTALAQALGCDRKTIANDREVLAAELPIEARAELPAHTLLLFEHLEGVALRRLQAADAAGDDEGVARYLDRLASLGERRVRVAGFLGVLDLKRADPLGMSIAARFNPVTGVAEFAAHMVPDLTPEQHVEFVKRATALARQGNGHSETGVSR